MPFHYISVRSLARQLVRQPPNDESVSTCTFSEEQYSNFSSAATQNDGRSTNCQWIFAIAALPNRCQVSVLAAELTVTPALLI
jgi:hypothetical protein